MKKHHVINDKIFEVVVLANTLLREFKVEYYNFDFTDDISCLGRCTNETIYINYVHPLQDDIQEIQQTILHEVAPAIAGLENGHNSYWKAIAKDIGLIEKKYKC